MLDNKYIFIKKFRKENTRTYLCEIQTPYGVCIQTHQSWTKNQKITIQSAINKTEYFQNQINEKYPNCFKIISPYIGSKELIKVRCLLCSNIFDKLPSLLLAYGNCNNCNIKTKNALSSELFLKKCNQTHKNFYDYSETVYINSQEKITIICPIHGKFLQVATEHCNGCKCQKCSRENSLVFSKKQFIKKCLEKNTKGVFYILECFNDNEKFYKIGITSNNIKKRYTSKRDMPYKFNIIHELFADHDVIWDIEKYLKLYIVNNNIHYIPNIKFTGYKTECFLL